MKAIETCYNGYRFRSRLEARWAVFFDALGVKYEYEPEGFELDDGTWYLPDFRVKCYGKRGDFDNEPFDLYIEVKGRMTEEDAHKIRAFSRTVDLWDTEHENSYYENIVPVLIVGSIPDARNVYDVTDSDCLGNYDRMDGVEIYPYNYETIDGDYFAAYPAATKDGHFYLMGDDSNYINSWDLDRVLRAYNKAKAARFER
ncbi:MAG: hypothetical protein IIY21_07950 [Clostridiales bacterium]|nr:hypothetical protein [Clostridiales bacterium]MBQ1572031.1 hypothetical protein [Clostridiales bacterium]